MQQSSSKLLVAVVCTLSCLALLSCTLVLARGHVPLLLTSAPLWPSALKRPMQQATHNQLPRQTNLFSNQPPQQQQNQQRQNRQQQQNQQRQGVGRTFTIANNRFVLGGVPLQLLSGSIHYHRIHPSQWAERLAAVKAMGLNAVQLYVPWNFHQPNTPGPEGVLPFEGWRDLPAFISAAEQQGLLVLLRPGPYICAEWEFGGLPAWLLSINSSMVLRSSDPQFLSAVDDWWGVLLPALAHLTVDKGGPIVMVQIENEYGYFGHDKVYLRHLAGLVRRHMGQAVVLYTVDGASLLPLVRGSLPGGEVLTTVDFGPGADVEAAFALQRRFNPPGKSPPFCVEFYTGWLTHYGEPMANTSAQQMVTTLSDILSTQGGTGNVNLYMAAGGTNFGPWAGANLFSTQLPAAGEAAAAAGGTAAAARQGTAAAAGAAAAAAGAAAAAAAEDGAAAKALVSAFNQALLQHMDKQAAAAATRLAVATRSSGSGSSGSSGSSSSSSGGSGSVLLPGPELWRLRQAALLLQHHITQGVRQQQQQHGGSQMQHNLAATTSLSTSISTSRSSRHSSSSSSSAGVFLEVFSPHITSYDYNCPLGEAGTDGQLGVGGPNKWDAIRQLLSQHRAVRTNPTAAAPASNRVVQAPAAPAAAAAAVLHSAAAPPVPLQAPKPALASYGPVTLTQGLFLTDALQQLSETCRGSSYANSSLGGGGGNTAAAGAFDAAAKTTAAAAAAAAAAAPSGITSSSRYPLPMEQYGQYYGLLVYSTVLDARYSAGGAVQLRGHDDTWVYLDGQLLGHSFRSSPTTVVVPPWPFAGGGSGSSSDGSSDGSSSSDSSGSSSEGTPLQVSRRKLSAATNTAHHSSSSTRGSSSSESSSRKEQGGRLLQLLVWPLGRNNFALGGLGGQLTDPKGLVGNVTLGGEVLLDWTVHHLCMEHGAAGSSGNSSSIDLPWRPLVPLLQELQQQHEDVAAAAAERAAAAGAAAGHAGADRTGDNGSSNSDDGGSSGSSSGSSSDSSSNDPQHRPFIRSAADSRAQVIIAAAAEAAAGSGPATAAARGVASIRAGRAAAAADGGAGDAGSNGSGSSVTGSSGSSTGSNSGSSGSSGSSSSTHSVGHNSNYLGRGALLLRGTLTVPPDPAATPAAPPAAANSIPPPGPAAAAATAAGIASPSAPPPLPSTFLHMGGGWGRGEVWVNGNSMGRYWSGQGPQMTLYVPGGFLTVGQNEVVVLELEGRLPHGIDVVKQEQQQQQQRGEQKRRQQKGGGLVVVGKEEEGVWQLGRLLPSIPTVTQPDFSGPPGGVEPL